MGHVEIEIEPARMISIAEIRAASILIVDDMEANVILLDGMLAAAGYTAVARTMDPTAVCALHREHRYDLILLDIQMPRMDGFQVMAGLKELETDAYLPVIVLTAQPAHKLRALAAGARDFVGKPFDLAEVLMRVNNMLEVRLLHKALVRSGERLEMRNQLIRETFGRYLSEEVMASILDSSSPIVLGGETRTVTMMMADLRGFTPMAEALSPAALVELMNNYLGAMIAVISEYAGTIDAFTGDGVFGLFGAPTTRPDDALRAVKCGIAMQLAMAGVNARSRELGLPELEMGIGIHTGEVVVGTIGSAQRAKYGVVGSAVNLTARVEAYTFGGQIMISESTRAAAGDDVVVEERLDVEPKGVSQPVTLYSVVGVRGRPDLTLAGGGPELVRPGSRVDVRFSLLEGKAVSGEVFDGRVMRLSRRGAEIEIAATVPPFANLKVRLVVDGQELPRDLYAKSSGAETAPGLLLLRFTSVPPEAEVALHALTTAAAATDE